MKRGEITKEWCLLMAEQEGTSEVGAGLAARDPVSDDESRVVPIERGRIALGRLVNLIRRRQRLSVEQLAARAEIEIGELMSVEDDAHFRPDPRTLYQLAQTLGVPQQTLMQLAGHAVARDARVGEAAIRFAARSEPLSRLAPEEREALDEFLRAVGSTK